MCEASGIADQPSREPGAGSLICGDSISRISDPRLACIRIHTCVKNAFEIAVKCSLPCFTRTQCTQLEFPLANTVEHNRNTFKGGPSPCCVLMYHIHIQYPYQSCLVAVRLMKGAQAMHPNIIPLRTQPQLL